MDEEGSGQSRASRGGGGGTPPWTGKPSEGDTRDPFGAAERTVSDQGREGEMVRPKTAVTDSLRYLYPFT